MLIPWRRYFAIPAFFLLATPLAVGIVRPDGPAAVLKEGRFLSPPPRMPESGAAWLKLPKEVDAYLSDHFGLRDALIRAHKDLTKPMLGFGNDSVLVGRDGRLFYLGEDTVRQSAGLILRDERVSDTVALLARMNAALKARGIRFLVAVPPNAPTIYQVVAGARRPIRGGYVIARNGQVGFQIGDHDRRLPLVRTDSQPRLGRHGGKPLDLAGLACPGRSTTTDPHGRRARGRCRGTSRPAGR